MATLQIGRLAEMASTKVQTIRYYEEIGLIRPFMRSEGGHRLYDAEDAKRLKFIRHARELGFSIDEIRGLLKLSDNPETSCAAADRMVETHLEQVELRIKKLQALRKELRRMVDDGTHGRAGNCRVLEVLKDHRHCGGEH
ncbi:MerR family transcriptional regulator [Aestuariivirga sp.]|uniref:MerR family transcriptional regulator n=1 Tax=Aestuariivirga sp. TaxID=2650926 RepID=UPI0039E5C18B